MNGLSNSNTAGEMSESSGGQPDILFSIVIPVFNREDTIQRCLDSCLSQDFDRFEVVAVNDASTDHSVEIMESYGDARLRIIKLPENRQVSYARNEGSRHSRGEWLVYLDSDDALLPGHLKRLARAAAEHNVSVITCPYLHDDGPDSPRPLPDEDVLDFAGYLRWWERMEGVSVDMFVARRRSTWERTPYPNTRGRQMLTNLRVYSHYDMLVMREPGGMVYTDAANRYNSDVSPAARERWRRDAPDMADLYNEVLEEFGAALSEHAPRRHREVQRALILQLFTSGDRWSGLRRSVRYLRQYPLCIKGWLFMVSGALAPGCMVWVRASSLVRTGAKRRTEQREGALRQRPAAG